MKSYDHRLIEKKWQKKWEDDGLYSPDVSKTVKNNKFYNLWMFPYPSAEGLHAGHAFASTGSDIYGRFQRMNGKTVFQPIGYDSFGIHSENFAIKINQKPQEVVERTTANYERQMRSLGHGYDWNRTVTTSDVDYYRWTQWLFLKMYERGLAYRKKAEVNFCPSCKTVLADEQVMTPAQAGKEARSADGQPLGIDPESLDSLRVCERCGTVVEKKNLDQWFFKITDYADRLLEGLERIDWSLRVKIAQKEWIGRSEGMIIRFKIHDSGIKNEYIEVFTTRPDTLNAVTFLATGKNYEEGSKDKVGEFSSKYAVEPISGRKIPIWDTNYVAPSYGTGIVMGVPAHDERDMEFAKKYDIDIIEKEPDQDLWNKIEKESWGKRTTTYHLRDWLVSRQRYWGAPIPMVNCEKCGWVPVPEDQLPVTLSEIEDYKPEGTGKGPLANHPEFYKTKCPKCGGEATRETDVMDTFVDSSWYFLMYPSVGLDATSSDTRSSLLRVSSKTSREAAGVTRVAEVDDLTESLVINHQSLPWSPEVNNSWLPVDLYFGGAEHSVLHLMYARFVNMVMYDLGLLNHDEPFPRFFAHGLMIKDGAKMSKSRGNVVNPDEYVEKYGADTLRMYLMFMGPMDGYPDFRDSGIEGMQKFIKRVWNLFLQTSDSGSSFLRVSPLAKTSHSASAVSRFADPRSAVLSKLHKTIKKVTEDIEQFKYNTAIASLMELVNVMSSNSQLITHDSLATLCQLIAPFAPHLAEELWYSVLGFESSVHESPWPVWDEKYLVENERVIIIQVNGKVRGRLIVDRDDSTNEVKIIELAKSDEKMSVYLKDKVIKKEIFVPGKLVNFVV